MTTRTKIIVVISLLVVAGGVWYFMSRSKTTPVKLTVTSAQYGPISKSITATGTIQPVDTVSVGSQISGVVKAIYTDFNQVVRKGQLLAKIDPSIIEAQVAVARANVATATSNRQLQQSTFDRQKHLFDLGAISKADYQIALNLYTSAKAAVANASAQLAISSKNLFYTNIYSPIDGMVLNRNVSAGQTIASNFNAPTLFVIAKDLTKMQVRAAVDEADIGDVKAGQNVSFTVDAFPNALFKGKVQEVLLHAKTTANVVTYTTLINVTNTDLKLKPGMTASITIYTEENPHALLIPTKALAFVPDSLVEQHFTIVPEKKERPKNASKSQESPLPPSRVWIKTKEKLYERTIATGLNDDTNVAVLKGLTESDSVVVGQELPSDAKSASGSVARSPFMPKMGSHNSKKK